MLRHLVFFNMKNEGEQAHRDAEQLMTMLRALPARIPQIVSLVCGTNIKRGPAACDVALETTFANEADLEIYRTHPDHQIVLNFVGEVTSQRWFVDYLSEQA